MLINNFLISCFLLSWNVDCHKRCIHGKKRKKNRRIPSPGSSVAGDELLASRIKLFLNAAYTFYMTCASYSSLSFSLSLSLASLFPLLKSTNGGVRMWTPGITDLLKVTCSGLLVRRSCPNPPESPWPADLAPEKPVHGELIRLPPSWKDSALPCRKDRTASRRCRHTKAGVVGERLVCLCSNTAVCFLCRFCLSGFLSPCTVRVCVSVSLSLQSPTECVHVCVCVCVCVCVSGV